MTDGSSLSLAVYGCGAIGGIVGASIQRAGHDVLLIDPWITHVEAMNENGLRVTSPTEDWTQQVTAITPDELLGRHPSFDAVLLSAKSMDTRGAVELLLPYLSPRGFIVSTQNGINEDEIASLAGAERTVGCVVLFAAELIGPGHAHRRAISLEADGTALLLGELDGQKTERLEPLRRVLTALGPVGLTDNLLGERWSKLARNSMHNGLSAITGWSVREILADERTRRIYIATGAEIIRVVDALGVRIAPIGDTSAEDLRAAAAGHIAPLDRQLAERAARMKPGGAPSTLQDVLKGRPTEIDHLNGYVVRRATAVGVSVPTNEAIVEAVRAVESARLAPHPDNLRLLEERLGDITPA